MIETRRLRFAVAAAALLATAAQAQTPAAGSLLVAPPELEDRNFAQSVILLVHHDEDGSLGLIVNRPTNLEPASVFPDIEPLERYNGVLFLGGPLGPRQLLLLVRAPAPDAAGTSAVLEDVYVSADPAALESVAEGRVDASRVRIYAGHAAWGPGQLETEIAAGGWQVMPGRSDLVFAREPLGLWRQTARSGAGLIAGLAALSPPPASPSAASARDRR